MLMILDKISKPNDIKSIDRSDMPELAKDIREFMVEKVSKTGGHLASSLGVVELTMALHLVFDLPKDKIIWDVGHQAYVHKILTGRKDGFDSLRQYGGMSGFPKRAESDCDSLDTGHSSTSISAGLGLIEAKKLSGEDYSVVSVIGDGSLTGGMVYEALNNASSLDTNFIIVLNDNNMAISKNTGTISKMMTNIRTAPGYLSFKDKLGDVISGIPVIGERVKKKLSHAKRRVKSFMIPDMFFENLGLTYLGPVDGHNLDDVINVLEDAKRLNGAVVVHVMTEKGKGYKPAELDPERFHGIGKFNPETGESLGAKDPDYSRVFGGIITKLAEKNEKITCISAAMPGGVGLNNFSKLYPKRFFDVGIAEEHAVTFAAGLALGGYKPYVCIYSTFMQRAYDQIVHDVCLQQLPVTFILDRAGLVGADGETHQGLLDISFMSSIPGMTVLAPKNAKELVAAVRFSETFNGPLTIRFSRGTAYRGLEEFDAPITPYKSELIRRGSKVAILACGNLVKEAVNAADILKDEGLDITVVNARFLHPFDKDMIKELATEHSLLVTCEEGELSGGFGQAVAAYVNMQGIDIKTIALAVPDRFVEQGDVSLLLNKLGLDSEGIADTIRKNI